MYGTRYSWQILTKLEFWRQIFRTIHEYQTSWKYGQWEGQECFHAGGHDRAGSPFSQCYKRAHHLDFQNNVTKTHAFCTPSVVSATKRTWASNGICESAHYKSSSLYETTNKQRCKSCRGVACRVPHEHATLGHKASYVWADCTWGGVINILDRKEPDRDRADPLKSSL
jgi:hypothetical protein